MKKIESKHLLGLEKISKKDIETIIDVGFTFREVLERPIKKVPVLNGKNIVNLFFENSTRTKISFELAEKRLSADVTNFSASSSSVQKGETLKDTIQNIHVMKMDCVVMRHPVPGSCLQLTNYVDVPIVNAGDGTHEHPTQALLDAYSIIKKHGNIRGKKVVIIGDILHSRVALSNIYCLQKLGAHVKVCGPSSLMPKYLDSLSVIHEPNLINALEWCDIANVLRIQLERQDVNYFPSLREYAMVYGINKKILDSLSHEITIMHPGPINRGVELSSDVADSKNSIILDQVENGVAIRMAVLYLLSNKITR